MSIADIGSGGALPNPVSTIVTEVLSEVEGGALVPLKVQVQVDLEIASSPRSPQELQDRDL